MSPAIDQRDVKSVKELREKKKRINSIEIILTFSLSKKSIRFFTVFI
jgi:hypothetical protein